MLFRSLKEKHNFILLNRQNVNLLDEKDIFSKLEDKKPDIIIHTAIEGGRRNSNDNEGIVYKNLLMFENLLYFKNSVKFILNIASGAEFDRSKDINLKTEDEIFHCVPKDYYGLSKNIISQKCLIYKNFYNLRIFGCFDENELDTRFIKNCILKSIKNENIVIHGDKKMDFFYLKDLIKVIEYILLYNCADFDINMSYEQKTKLSEIATNIVNLNKSKSKIVIENLNDLNYNGDFKKLMSLPIMLEGIENGIKKTIINITIHSLLYIKAKSV